MNDAVEVFISIHGQTVRVGTAYFSHHRQKVTTTFHYAHDWLADPQAFPLGPDLPLDGGPQFTDGLPGALSDCAPDQWGRHLIERRSHAAARRAGRQVRSVDEIDFLLGVSDLTRQGSLRFRAEGRQDFLAADTEVPKLVELPRLLDAASRVAKGGDDDYAEVKALLDAGTASLGGARPKAMVRSENDRFLIAKFPHHHDAWDVERWEKVALDLAAKAGVRVPASRLSRVGPATVLLTDRFDRAANGDRIPYISALTLVSGKDGGAFDYEDVVAHLEESGAGDNAELEALFRRVALSVAVHNTDDHLRNTGFLRSPDGWRLSPQFDLNPNPDLATRRHTTISGVDAAIDEAEGLLRLSQWCRLDDQRMREVIGEVADAAADWHQVAVRNGVTTTQLDRFADMFEQQRRVLSRLSDGSHPG